MALGHGRGGARPKGSAAHVVSGTRNKAVGKNGADFDLVHKLPECPDTILPPGQELWNVCGEQLIKAGLLQKGDMFSFTLMARLYGRVDTALAGEGEVLASDINTLRLLFIEFGFTPCSRRRIVPNENAPKQNPFAAFTQQDAA